MLPKEEREAEMREAAKQAAKAGKDKMEYDERDQADPLTGDTINADAVGNSDLTPIGRFPFWDVAETATDTEDIFVNPTDSNWAFENNTDFMPELETFSPVEFDVAAPPMTDQAVIGNQLEAVGTGICGDLRWIVPEQDLPFGCN